jgi:hypothetical protein
MYHERPVDINVSSPTSAPTGSPTGLDVPTASITSTASTGNWMEIACTERNGDINGYDVQLLIRGVVIRDVNVPSLTYTATELTPFTIYTFRVAGVNINGTGPFAERTFTTAEARKPPSSML